MKNRFLLTIILLLLFLSISFAWGMFTTSAHPSTQAFNAAIHRDCAPWDGTAFTVMVDLPNGNILDISIWQSPNINFPETFHFPDTTTQIGNAILQTLSSLPDQLSGTVTFKRVTEQNPVEGKFDLKAENGQLFKGTFIAKWDHQMIMCG